MSGRHKGKEQTRDRVDNRTPNIPLSRDVIQELRGIFEYTDIISNLVSGFNKEDVISVLKGVDGRRKDFALQHAIIFCLKTIGSHVKNATKILGRDIDEMPLFCRNLAYLRNSLIHHLPSISMPDDSLDLLASIATKIGHVFRYFSMVINQKNTAVDLGAERYKVFLDVHELHEALTVQYSRANRSMQSQEYYLKAILAAIQGLEFEMRGVPLNAASLGVLPVKKFYALQNLLELIATLANPSPEYRLLSQQTRDVINATHLQADMWLRTLGNNRMESVHRALIISPADMAVHIANMIQLKNNVLLNLDFQRSLGINLNPVFSSSSVATSQIMQSLTSSRGSAAASGSSTSGDDSVSTPTPASRSTGVPSASRPGSSWATVVQRGAGVTPGQEGDQVSANLKQKK